MELSFSQSNTLLLIGFVSFLTIFIRRLQKPRNTPPTYAGWIPWLGCAIEFGKSPLYFIEKCRKNLGPIFTLKVAGRSLTFITDPEDYKHFFTSNKTDFQQAVQQPVQNTASIPVKSFYESHTKIHDTVKWRLAQTQLTPFCKSLSFKFSSGLRQWGEKGSGDLNTLVRGTMYKAVLDNLFGEQVLPTSPERLFRELEANFVRFDEDFEYASQLPPVFLKEWSKSKWYLLGIFREIVGKLDVSSKPTTEETLLQTLVRDISGPYAPNFSMLMMWASLANAIPITFWTLGFMLTHPEIHKKAKEEVKQAMKEKVIQGVADCDDLELTQEDLVKMPLLKCCMLEAIRLRSPGVITRGVKEPMKIRGYNVPAGDMLMLSPYWAHRNPTYFPEPETFNPDRWKTIDLEKNLFLEGFVAFGGGRYMCPGRWFALMEIHLFIAHALYLFDIKPKDPLPKLSSLHIVGTQQPMGSMNVDFLKVN